jgi:hypothetical protein
MEMDFPMADTAKGDEIFLHIIPQKAARLNVMDLEIFETSTPLASPATAPQHLPAKPLIGILVQAKLVV